MEQDASQGAAATLQAWCEHGRDTAHAEATHQQQQQDSSDLTVGFDGDRPPSPATTTPDESTHDFRVGLITRSWFAPCQRCCMQRTTAGSGRDALVNWFDVDDHSGPGYCNGCRKWAPPSGHRLLQVVRNTYQDACRTADLALLTPVSRIQPYSINNHKVTFLRPRPSKPSSSGGSGAAGARRAGEGTAAARPSWQFQGHVGAPCCCETCCRQLMDRGYQFCSLYCLMQAEGGGSGSGGRSAAGSAAAAVAANGPDTAAEAHDEAKAALVLRMGAASIASTLDAALAATCHRLPRDGGAALQLQLQTAAANSAARTVTTATAAARQQWRMSHSVPIESAAGGGQKRSRQVMDSSGAEQDCAPAGPADLLQSGQHKGDAFSTKPTPAALPAPLPPPPPPPQEQQQQQQQQLSTTSKTFGGCIIVKACNKETAPAGNTAAVVHITARAASGSATQQQQQQPLPARRSSGLSLRMSEALAAGWLGDDNNKKRRRTSSAGGGGGGNNARVQLSSSHRTGGSSTTGSADDSTPPSRRVVLLSGQLNKQQGGAADATAAVCVVAAVISSSKRHKPRKGVPSMARLF